MSIIGVDFGGEGGAWRSIMEFYSQLKAKGVDLSLINRNRRKSSRKVLGSLLFGHNILINGLDTLHYWDCIFLAFFKKDLSIYLHETSYMLDEFQKHDGFKFKFVERILAKRRILAVSHQAADHYRERFGNQQIEVVYETIAHSKPPSLDPSKTNIVMVGSINSRKGAELFAEVAGLARERHPDWVFHWAGMGNESLLGDAPVIRHGWQRDPANLLRQSQLFFLSSVDDPFPLACIEAFQWSIPCVAYRGTGTSEVIRKHAPDSVFDEYTAGAALRAIERSLANPETAAAFRQCYEEDLAPEVFTRRISSLFDIPDSQTDSPSNN